jgi:RNA polymerase-binding transcription factor DksA
MQSQSDELINRLFSSKECERCGAPIGVRALSFNKDEVICVKCKEMESNDLQIKLMKAKYWQDAQPIEKKKRKK